LIALETSYLLPNTTFTVVTVVALGVFVIWPLVEAVARRRWIWAVAIVLLSPFAGILWFAIGRRTHPARRSRVSVLTPPGG
jgi:Na+/melibiose symporter-like transporter